MRALLAADAALAGAVLPCSYDGDTPKQERGVLRASCNVFLTNPDTLHAALLPGHKAWARVLRPVESPP